MCAVVAAFVVPLLLGYGEDNSIFGTRHVIADTTDTSVLGTSHLVRRSLADTFVGNHHRALQTEGISVVGHAVNVNESDSSVAVGTNIRVEYSDDAVLAGANLTALDADRSVVIGYALLSDTMDQVVLGRYNAPSSASLVVGMGGEDQRKNALEVFANGTLVSITTDDLIARVHRLEGLVESLQQTVQALTSASPCGYTCDAMGSDYSQQCCSSPSGQALEYLSLSLPTGFDRR